LVLFKAVVAAVQGLLDQMRLPIPPGGQGAVVFLRQSQGHQLGALAVVVVDREIMLAVQALTAAVTAARKLKTVLLQPPTVVAVEAVQADSALAVATAARAVPVL
jgi:hypothetical protein